MKIKQKYKKSSVQTRYIYKQNKQNRIDYK